MVGNNMASRGTRSRVGTVADMPPNKATVVDTRLSRAMGGILRSRAMEVGTSKRRRRRAGWVGWGWREVRRWVLVVGLLVVQCLLMRLMMMAVGTVVGGMMGVGGMMVEGSKH